MTLPPAGPVASTSTPGTASKPDGAKIAVRRRTPTLTAVRLEAPRPVELADGSVVQAQPGAYLITRGQTVISCVPTLGDQYEIVVEGQLLVPADIRHRIEATTGIGSTLTAADLVTAIERLAPIDIGTVHVEFTPGQLAEIAHRATKRGRTVEAELHAVVDRIKDEIFHRG
jgi:hypothetical protein